MQQDDRQNSYQPEPKSYVLIAWVNLLLYYLGFYIVGLIVNLVFLKKSKQYMEETNIQPKGRGCLLFLIWTHLIIPISLVIWLITSILGVSLFVATSTNNVDYEPEVRAQLQSLASKAFAYYYKPAAMGGASKNWETTARDSRYWLDQSVRDKYNIVVSYKHNSLILTSEYEDVILHVKVDNNGRAVDLE